MWLGVGMESAGGRWNPLSPLNLLSGILGSASATQADRDLTQGTLCQESSLRVAVLI